MTTVEEALAGVSNLGLDTAPIIYFVEAHPRYDKRVTAIFQRISAGTLTGVTSVISLSEVLVQPVQQNNMALAQSFRTILLQSTNFLTLPIDAACAEQAAALRARYRLRTPDALQIATALSVGCQAFLTNDAGLRRVDDLRVITLDDLTL